MDRKKIKSLLGQAILRVNEVVPNFDDLDKILPLLEQAYDEADKSNWISVKERLPEFDEEVLVTNDKNKEMWWFCHRSNDPSVTTAEYEFCNYMWMPVTHWQEIKKLENG